VEKKKNSSSETTSGARANKTNGRLEAFVGDALKRAGYKEFWNHKTQMFENRKVIGGKQYLKQALCGKTIYETDRYVDFLIVNKAKFKDGLIIECKWQESGGSVDEKYPYVIFNIIKTEIPTIVLIDGGGYRPAALKFLKGEASKDSAFKGAWTMAEFQKQINDGFLG
jgi:hypothetical protein